MELGPGCIGDMTMAALFRQSDRVTSALIRHPSEGEGPLDSRPTWVLFDYGEVISLPQPVDEVQALADASGRDLDDFIARYWIHRLDYDRGDLTPEEYWTTVLDSVPRTDQLTTLTNIDSASWTHPNLATLETLAVLKDSGLRLAILSNAPHIPARAIESAAWLDGFERIFFSCDLRLTKPDPEIFRIVVEELGVPPQDILFVDDRIENIETAEQCGMRVLHFRGSDQQGDIRKLAGLHP